MNVRANEFSSETEQHTVLLFRKKKSNLNIFSIRERNKEEEEKKRSAKSTKFSFGFMVCDHDLQCERSKIDR